MSAILALLGKNSKIQKIRNCVYKIHNVLQNTGILFYFGWLRRSTIGIRVGDSLSRDIPEMIISDFTISFINSNLGKVPEILFSTQQLCDMRNYEHKRSYLCECSKKVDTRLIDSNLRNKETTVLFTIKQNNSNAIINFLKSRNMKGVLICPMFYNSNFYQRLKIDRNVSGPFVYDSKKIFLNWDRRHNLQMSAIFFFNF